MQEAILPQVDEGSTNQGHLPMCLLHGYVASIVRRCLLRSPIAQGADIVDGVVSGHGVIAGAFLPRTALQRGVPREAPDTMQQSSKKL